MPSLVRAVVAGVVAIVAVAAGVALDGTSSFGGGRPARTEPGPAVTPDGAGADAPTIPGDLGDERPTDLLPTFEPYDYAKAAPPREPTRIDGTYLRVVTIEEAGGAQHAVPVHCLRCVPYSVDAGVQTLTLFEGRYYLEHQIDGFRALGHYVVEGRRLSLFNDVNCSGVRGRYAWERRGSELSLDVVDDPCPYVDERSHDLTFGPWTAIDLCTSGVERWYPAFLGC